VDLSKQEWVLIMWRTIEEGEDTRCNYCKQEPREFCWFEGCQCKCHKEKLNEN